MTAFLDVIGVRFQLLHLFENYDLLKRSVFAHTKF